MNDDEKMNVGMRAKGLLGRWFWVWAAIAWAECRYAACVAFAVFAGLSLLLYAFRKSRPTTSPVAA